MHHVSAYMEQNPKWNKFFIMSRVVLGVSATHPVKQLYNI